MRILLSLATAVSILAVALLVLFTPLWTHVALSMSGATAPGGPAGAADASDRTIGDLLTLGEFTFPAADGSPMYTADERGHMRDVRVVLFAFLAVALAAAVFVVARLRRAGRADWAAVARGGAGLVIGVVVLGAIGLVAFGLAFELFHRILFPGGNWAFSADSNLIRLYPLAFWQLSSAALGLLAVLGGGLTWLLARRRAAAAAE